MKLGQGMGLGVKLKFIDNFYKTIIFSDTCDDIFKNVSPFQNFNQILNIYFVARTRQCILSTLWPLYQIK
jgi:hypothetical protein